MQSSGGHADPKSCAARRSDDPVAWWSSFSYAANSRTRSHNAPASDGTAGRITTAAGPPSRAGNLANLGSNHLDEHALLPPPVELPVEDLLPRAKIEPASGDRHHHFPSHHLALQVRVGVVLAGVVVAVLIR